MIASVSAARTTQPAASAAQGKSALSPTEQAQLTKLKARDRQVRAHEQAHQAAAGGLAISGANFTYQRGPDGINYAIGGEVRIDASPGRTPEETLRRAETLRAAALAPADPSGQDRAVAAQAGQMAQQARSELSAADAPGRPAANPALKLYNTSENSAVRRVDTYA